MIFLITIISFSGMLIFTNSSEKDSNAPDISAGIPDDEKDPSNNGGNGEGDSGGENEDPTRIDEEHKITNNQEYAYKLVNKNTRNILFVGTDKSNGIYDTIGVINIDEKKQQTKVIMFPRDIYVDYSDKIKEQITKLEPNYWKVRGVYRINNLHNIGRMLKYEDGNQGQWSINFLNAYLKEVYDIECEAYVKVNTKGFVDLVDLFGGVDINVPIRMEYDDPYQDLHINLMPGNQHLNGKQAEGFVRFRNNNSKSIEIGDFERKQNQMDFMEAFFKQKANFLNLAKANDLYKTISQNIATNITASGYTRYVKLFKKSSDQKYEIEKYTIEGEGCSIRGDYYVKITTLSN